MGVARSNRQVYKIEEITVNRGGTEEPIVAKIKKSHADLFGLTPIAADDAIWTGTFGGSGSNAGKTYLRKLGGFRERPFTFVAKDKFSLTVNAASGEGTTTEEFKSITIGLPKGATALEVKNWLDTLAVRTQVAAIITPNGYRFAYVSGAG